MHLPKLLYLKINRIFSKFFTNPVEDREIHEHPIGEESSILSLKILDVGPHGVLFRIDLDDMTFICVMHESCVHVINFDDAENCLDLETEFGNRFEEAVNQEFLQLLEYLEVTIKVFERDFEEVTVRNFDIVNVDDKLNLKFKRGEKKVSVDKGIGKLIKELDEEHIPTISACCCGSAAGNHISLFCNEQEKERIKEKIKTHFVVGLDGILVEPADEFKSVDGKQNLVFKW